MNVNKKNILFCLHALNDLNNEATEAQQFIYMNNYVIGQMIYILLRSIYNRLSNIFDNGIKHNALLCWQV